MDDIVKQALAKWPDVPHCYGWLGLDARGGWWMRDARAQACGSFSSGTPGAKGAPLQHSKLIDFIHRNYEADAQGQWFFQNGPQRVYVELEAAPWIWRIHVTEAGGFHLTAHTGQPAQVRGSVLDETGRLYLDSDLGLGLVHTQDMVLAADAVEQGCWQPDAIAAADLPRRFGYVQSPENLFKVSA